MKAGVLAIGYCFHLITVFLKEVACPFSFLGHSILDPRRERNVYMPDALTLDLTTWIAMANMILADVIGAEASTCVFGMVTCASVAHH